MEQRQDKPPFPGQKKGLIRVFIKRKKQQEEESQLCLYLFDENSKDQ